MPLEYRTVPYLLTLISDRIKDLDSLLNQLKDIDGQYTAWGDEAIKTIISRLYWLKTQVEARKMTLAAANKEPAQDAPEQQQNV